MEMEAMIDGYLVKVTDWGDSITPMYKFDVYIPKKKWWQRNKLIWTEDKHKRELAGGLTATAKRVIESMKQEDRLWEEFGNGES